MEFRNDIQGLRAIAVLSVWLFHLHHSILPGGFIGVDIFFVISGFLISSIILHQKETGKFKFHNFYLSRIKRIVPAYYVFLIIAAVAVMLIYIPGELDKRKLIQSIIFNSNNYFATSDNYFGAASTENPFLHTWTLAIEMQFYLFLPLIVFLLNRKKALYLSVGLCIMLFAYTQYQIHIGNKGLMYYSLLARTPEFLLGVILSLLKWENKLNVKTQSALGITGLVLIVASVFFINSETTFPGLITLIPCGGAILILVNKEGVVNSWLSTKYLVCVGALSYSIYLWHWGILALMRYHFLEYTLSIPQYIFAVILTLLLSYLSYRFIEQKFRKVDIKQFAIRFSIILLPLLCLLLVMSNVNKSLYHNIPKDFTNSDPMGTDNHRKYIKDVIQGDMQAKDTLLFIGNSHALVTKPFVEIVGKKYDFCFRSITNNTYAALPGYNINLFTRKSRREEYSNLTSIVKKMLPKSPVILLFPTFDVATPSDHVVAFDSLASLLRSDQQVILLSDYPILDKHPIRVNKSIVKSSDTGFNLEYRTPPAEIMNFIKSHDNFHYLDLSDSKAFDNAPYYNDTLMYYDVDHLNIYGSKVYAKFSGDKLGRLIEELLHKRGGYSDSLVTVDSISPL